MKRGATSPWRAWQPGWLHSERAAEKDENRKQAQHIALLRAEAVLRDYDSALVAAYGPTACHTIAYDGKGWYRNTKVPKAPALREADVLQLTAKAYAMAHAQELGE